MVSKHLKIEKQFSHEIKQKSSVFCFNVNRLFATNNCRHYYGLIFKEENIDEHDLVCTLVKDVQDTFYVKRYPHFSRLKILNFVSLKVHFIYTKLIFR